MKRSLKHSRAAFTMIEIMLVVLIIVLLLGFAINKMGGSLDFARETRIKGDIQSLGQRIPIPEPGQPQLRRIRPFLRRRRSQTRHRRRHRQLVEITPLGRPKRGTSPLSFPDSGEKHAGGMFWRKSHGWSRAPPVPGGRAEHFAPPPMGVPPRGDRYILGLHRPTPTTSLPGGSPEIRAHTTIPRLYVSPVS